MQNTNKTNKNMKLKKIQSSGKGPSEVGPNDPERRSFLKYTVGGVAGLVVGGIVGYYAGLGGAAPGVTTTVTQTGMQTAVQTATVAPAGVTVRLAVQDDPYNFALPGMMDAWKAETGNTVQKTVLGYGPLHDEAMIDFASHTDLFDFYATDAVWAGQYYPYLADLTPRLSDLPKSDIPPAMLQLGQSSIGGPLKQVAVPLQPHNILTIYRKDIFAKNNMAFAAPLDPTFEEIKNFAEKLNDPTHDFYGFSTRCQTGAAGGQEFLQLITAFGGRVFDKDFHPHLDSDQAKSALRWLIDMKPYMPPDYAALAWDETLATIQQSRVAISSEWYARVHWAEDPTKSKVAGNLGYAMYEHAAKNTDFQENSGMWGIGINADSKNQDVAWQFIKYLYDHNKQFVLAGSTPALISVINDLAEIPWWPAARAAALESWTRGHSWGRPPIPEFDWLQTHGGDVFNAILIGSLDLDKGLATLNADFEKMLTDAGYYKNNINPLPSWYFDHYTPTTYP